MIGRYETLFRRFLFPAYETHLRGRGTLRYLNEYDRLQWASPEQIAAIQWRKLQFLVRHCWDEVPYYRRRWSEAGAAPGEIRSLEDFARLPVLTKQDIRANYDDLHARSYRGRMLYKTTSGSTGEPLLLGYTRESYERRTAVMWRGYTWAGARMGRRTLYLWGGPLSGGFTFARVKDRIFQHAQNQKVLNTYSMSGADMTAYADQIDRFRPEVIVGYVNPLVRLGRWLLAAGRRVHRPESIVGAAEALHDFQRRILEDAFGCKAYDAYGCREFMLIASECAEQNGLHVNADHLVVEVVSPRPALDGSQVGELAITDLHNLGMPFVRYLNEDLATLATGGCRCGRGLPRLARVAGRRLDALRAPDGRVVPGEFFPSMFNNAPGVQHFRVRQKSLDRLDIRVVADAAFDAQTERRCIEDIGRVFGPSTTVAIERVESLPANLNGKVRVTVSEIG